MLDVHAPHEPILGWKEFFVHLFTITIGLLIALSLEGLVEWQHHRHLVHEAEASLRDEIQHNANEMNEALAQLKTNESELDHDITVLKQAAQTGKFPKHESMAINFHLHGFESVAWKTAQTTGATGYIDYQHAKEYSEIYTTQDELSDAEKQAARDAIVSLSPFMSYGKNDPDPSKEEAAAINSKIELFRGQLLLVESLMQSLDKSYQAFLSAHPNH